MAFEKANRYPSVNDLARDVRSWLDLGVEASIRALREGEDEDQGPSRRVAAAEPWYRRLARRLSR